MTDPDRGNVTVDEEDLLAHRFEAHRTHLRAAGYRMLGSLAEADDAVQEAWLHLRRADPDRVHNLGGWLTTTVARICLDMLRSRQARREVPLPDPVVGPAGATDPEQAALHADSIGLALLVVLDTLAPAERVAFVLHDIFAVPFDDIAPVVSRTPAAARQLASRARRRVQAQAPVPDADPARQRTAVDAFLTAARDGDFDALVAVLDPDVVLHADTGTGVARFRGAQAVGEQAMAFAARAPHAHPTLVNGAPGFVVIVRGRPVAVMAFTVRGGRIAELDILADPARLSRLDLAAVRPASAVPAPAGRSASPDPGRSRARRAAGPGSASPRPPPSR
jgi:RNA polymerase sigma-70 factor, ECF subfamily